MMTMDNNSVAINATKQIHRWPSLRAKKWTISFLKLAKKDDNIKAVVAIGSSVRPVVSSVDLDIVVFCVYPSKLTTKPPIEVDLRVYAADQVDSFMQSGSDLIGWSIKFGHVLFQRQDFWNNILKSWHDKVPLPSADTAIQRAEDTFRRLHAVLELGDNEAAYEQAISYITHLSRAALIKKHVYPASRPELPGQLRRVGCTALAVWLENLLKRTVVNFDQIPSKNSISLTGT
jgi:hypothetical protein